MTHTPFQASSHLKETLISYLETAYKISHQDIYRERRAALQEAGIVAQKPFIETTPEFRTGETLREIAHKSNAKIPDNLADLFAFGTPLGSRPLWIHQQ